MQKLVSEAAGVILATPEYHGGYSSVIKLVIDNLGFPSSLKGKPVALLGVAAGKIGAIKALESLRSICSHVGSIVLPGAISIARVNSAFNEDGSCKDPAIEKQIRSVATNLINYVSRHVCPKTHLEEIVRSEVS
jgi:FMN reductase